MVRKLLNNNNKIIMHIFSLIFHKNAEMVSSSIHVRVYVVWRGFIYLFLVKQLTSGAWWDCFHPRQSHVSMLDLKPFTALAGGNQKKLTWKYTYILMEAVNACRWNLCQNMLRASASFLMEWNYESSPRASFSICENSFYSVTAADLTCHVWV